jgi:hypothetical protein
MSSLGPDGTFLDERPTSRIRPSPYPPREGATDVSAAPLWTAFRDRYTRARERRPLDESRELVCCMPWPI